MREQHSELARDCAACELVGFVVGMLKGGDVPESHRAPLQKLVDRVRETQGTDKEAA